MYLINKYSSIVCGIYFQLGIRPLIWNSMSASINQIQSITCCSSDKRQEPHSNGPERSQRSLRENQAHTRRRQRQEENEDHQSQPEPGMERDADIVSSHLPPPNFAFHDPPCESISSTQRTEAGGQRPTAADRGVGLGPHVAQRLHGLAFVRHFGAAEVSCRRMVQAAHAGRGGVLQRACARGGRRYGPNQDSDEGKTRVELYCWVGVV